MTGTEWANTADWQRSHEEMAVFFALLHRASKARRAFCGNSDLWDGPSDRTLSSLAACLKGNWRRRMPHVLIFLTRHPDRLLAWQREHFPAGLPDGVWVGATIEDQEGANQRIPVLLQVDASVRCLHPTKLLGPVDIGPWIGTHDCRSGCGWRGWSWDRGETDPDRIEQEGDEACCPNCGSGYHCGEVEGAHEPEERRENWPDLWPIHWVVAEQSLREPSWGSLQHQCWEAEVPYGPIGSPELRSSVCEVPAPGY